MLAIELDDIAAIEELIFPGRFPHSQLKTPADLFAIDREGRTALFYAAAQGSEKMVWLLLSSLPGTGLCCRRGSLLEVVDQQGYRAEDWAREQGQDAIAAILEKERLRIDMFE